jgi:hypothetical protein
LLSPLPLCRSLLKPCAQQQTATNPNPAFSSSFFPYTTTITQASAAALVH